MAFVLAPRLAKKQVPILYYYEFLQIFIIYAIYIYLFIQLIKLFLQNFTKNNAHKL
jgi:hypothetical protein